MAPATRAAARATLLPGAARAALAGVPRTLKSAILFKSHLGPLNPAKSDRFGLSLQVVASGYDLLTRLSLSADSFAEA